MRKKLPPGRYPSRRGKAEGRNGGSGFSRGHAGRLALYERLIQRIASLESVSGGDIGRFESDLSGILGKELDITRVSVLVHDGEASRKCLPDGEGRTSLSSPVLECPVVSGDRILGCLRVERSKKLRPWTVEDILFFSGVAGRAAIVLLNRKRLDILERLKVNERFLKKAQEVARTGHWQIDIPENRITWSEETYRIFGVPEGTPISLEFFYATVHPGDRKAVKKRWDGALRGESYLLRHRILRGKETRWLEERAEFEFDHDGKPVSALGTVRDITLQVNAEQRLDLYRQNLENLVAYRTADLENAMKRLDVERSFLTTILQSFSYPFCVIDASDCSLVIRNDAAAALGPEGAVHCHDLFFRSPVPCSPRDRVCPLREVAGTGLPYVSETSLGREDAYYKRYCHPVFDRDGRVTHVIMYIIDVTTDRLLGEQLTRETARANELKERAEAANRAKSAFLSSMSHEIRTPLNAVIGFAHLLKDSPLNAVQKDHADHLLDSSRHLLRLINDVLDFSKIEANRMELDIHDFEPSRHIDQVCALVAEEAARKGLDLRVDLRSIPLVLRGDGSRFAQVLLNLVDNGVKFCGSGEVSITAEAVEWRDTSAVIRFQVKDTGIGMSGEQTERLFSDFMQGDAGTTRQYGGTGLGLAISKRLVEMMKGRIWAESAPGEGSTFSFEIPFGMSSSLPEKSDLLEPFIGKRVLVADRSADDRDVLARMAAEFGMQAGEASDLSSAREMIKEAEQRGVPWDILLLDSRLPGAGAVTAEETARSRTGGTAVFLLLPFGNTLSGKEQETGHSLALTKPVTPSRLCDALAELASGARGSPGFPAGAGAAGVRESIRGAHALLAEDNYVNREVTCALLGSLGVGVTVAEDGREAVEAFRQSPEKFDLVIMDVQMPTMDGLQATREIRSLPGGETVPIIAMTANAFEEDGRRCIEAGMNAHVSKPLEPDGLIKILSRWLPAVRGGGDGVSPSRDAVPVVVLPEIEALSGVDMRAGLSSVRGDLSLYMDLLRQFADRHGEDGRRILADLASGDAAAAGKRAHGLRGVSASLGLEAIRSAAADIEKETRKGSTPEDLLPRAESLDGELRRFCGRIRNLSAPENPAGPVTQSSEGTSGRRSPGERRGREGT